MKRLSSIDVVINLIIFIILISGLAFIIRPVNTWILNYIGRLG